MVITKNKNIVVRKVHGSFFLVDIADDYSGNKCALYEINETGSFIWNSINDARTAEQLTLLLKHAIIENIDYQILYDDVTEFLDSLAARKFVEI